MKPELIIASAIGAFFAFMSTNISKWIEILLNRRIRITNEVKLLKAELYDIRRHCLSNLDAINRINLDMGKPSAIHFFKIKVVETSIILSEETFRHIDVKYSSLIYRLKIVVNNLNVDADAVIECLKSEGGYPEALHRYIDYMKMKLAYTADRLTYELTNIDYDYKPKFSGLKRPKHVLYESLTNIGKQSVPLDVCISADIDEFLKKNKLIYKDINDND